MPGPDRSQGAPVTAGKVEAAMDLRAGMPTAVSTPQQILAVEAEPMAAALVVRAVVRSG